MKEQLSPNQLAEQAVKQITDGVFDASHEILPIIEDALRKARLAAFEESINRLNDFDCKNNECGSPVCETNRAMRVLIRQLADKERAS